MTYKWNTPYEWFTYYIQDKDRGELHSLLLEFVEGVDGDTIQRKFQALMEDDGYFDNQDKPHPYNRGREQGCCDVNDGYVGTRENPYGVPSMSTDAYDWHLGYGDGWDEGDDEENSK